VAFADMVQDIEPIAWLDPTTWRDCVGGDSDAKLRGDHDAGEGRDLLTALYPECDGCRSAKVSEDVRIPFYGPFSIGATLERTSSVIFVREG
jgi:hypothetical protein